MNHEFVEDVCKLIDAVIYAECTIEGSEDGNAVLGEVGAALTVVRKIRAAEELSRFHPWAENQLAALATGSREASSEGIPGDGPWAAAEA